MAAKLVFYSKREHYGVEDIRGTMTVGQMIEFLSDFDEDQEMVIAFDGGYTYGCITTDRFEEVDPEQEEEEE